MQLSSVCKFWKKVVDSQTLWRRLYEVEVAKTAGFIEREDEGEPADWKAFFVARFGYPPLLLLVHFFFDFCTYKYAPYVPHKGT